MHELGITRNIVAIVAERAGDRRVSRVRLQVGRLSGIEVPAIRFCYDACAEGTVLEGSQLQIDEVEGRGRCHGCGEEVEAAHVTARCPCERKERLSIVRGEELLIKEMEIVS